MKAALNGGLNLSILDGWWDEWYDGNNGWAIPSADGVEDPDRRDDLEATALYELIENEVAPRFYDLDENGIPGRWIEMVRHTLKSLGPKVLADRMVGDYVHDALRPGRRRRRGPSTTATRAPATSPRGRSASSTGWSGVRIDHVDSHGVGDIPEVGTTMSVHAFVSLGDLAPDDVDVQVVHGRVREEDDLVDARVDVAEARSSPTRPTGTASTASVTLGLDRARSATPSAWCRRTTTWRRSPSSGWSRLPDGLRPSAAHGAGARDARDPVEPRSEQVRAASRDLAARPRRTCRRRGGPGRC